MIGLVHIYKCSNSAIVSWNYYFIYKLITVGVPESDGTCISGKLLQSSSSVCKNWTHIK